MTIRRMKEGDEWSLRPVFQNEYPSSTLGNAASKMIFTMEVPGQGYIGPNKGDPKEMIRKMLHG